MPSELSGGMARRVATARAVALDPMLVMYDEPFSGLDPISLNTAARLVRNLNDAMGLTSILVSHELGQTLEVADEVIVLDQGRVAFQGPVVQARTSSDPLVYQYMHEQPDGPVRFHYPAVDLKQDFGVAGRARPRPNARPNGPRLRSPPSARETRENLLRQAGAGLNQAELVRQDIGGLKLEHVLGRLVGLLCGQFRAEGAFVRLQTVILFAGPGRLGAGRCGALAQRLALPLLGLARIALPATLRFIQRSGLLAFQLPQFGNVFLQKAKSGLWQCAARA
jgi:hypothetical protein